MRQFAAVCLTRYEEHLTIDGTKRPTVTGQIGCPGDWSGAYVKARLDRCRPSARAAFELLSGGYTRQSYQPWCRDSPFRTYGQRPAHVLVLLSPVVLWSTAVQEQLSKSTHCETCVIVHEGEIERRCYESWVLMSTLQMQSASLSLLRSSPQPESD